MGRLSNHRHELFVREIIKAKGNATEAYRRVYPLAEPRDSARASAGKLLSFPHIRTRYQEVLTMAIKRSDVTVDAILGEYEEARLMARGDGKTADMLSASEKKAKLVGLLRDRVEAGNVGDFDNMDDISSIVERVAAEAGPEVAHALMKAFNLGSPEPTPSDTTALEAAKPINDTVN